MSHEEQPQDAEAQAQAHRQDSTLATLSSHPRDWALFLDIDGTLIDLAETPDAVVVPPSLPPALHSLASRLGGALALVTGRSITYADTLFSPFRFPVAGLHGAEWRGPDGDVHGAEITPALSAAKEALIHETAGWPGVIIEDKGAAVAAHYRLAPDRRTMVERLMQRHLDAIGPAWTLQQGKMVVEIRPASADKGRAVEAFLATALFSGRRPIAIGDDITDEAMFRVANAAGGQSLRVGPPGADTQAQASLPSAAALREMIRRLST